MTVIAWDGRTLAADKMACHGTIRCTTTKIWRVGDALVGSAGESDAIREMVAWFAAGPDPATFPAIGRDKDNWPGLLVCRRGKPILRYERTPFPIEFEDTFFAVGSGSEIARAAMYLGKTAREAVLVAIALDSGCGNGVDTLTLEGAP